jgi:choline dehydrogenase-like flavoprotein
VGTVARVHSIWEPVTGIRRSADTLLNRSNSNLTVRTNAEVEKILFEGDKGVPNELMKQNLEAGDEEEKGKFASNIARCVLFVNGETACVKEGGRIYISAGTFLTPTILIRSGIGPDGERVVNPHVGQHLSDKVAFLEVINFDPEMALI